MVVCTVLTDTIVPGGAGDGLPGRERRRRGVGNAVDHDAAGVVRARVPHPDGGRAVVVEVHDPGDGVHAQEGLHPLGAPVEDVLPLGVRAAVGPEVRADHPDGAVEVRGVPAIAG